jgi:conjugative relaxase-like TrwC/TraI family protein
MSMRRMTLGAGFRYLMSSVVRSDRQGPTADPLMAYYTAEGTPPGRFLGAGLAGLDGGMGVGPGSVVSEEHLWRMLGMLQDPVTGQPLGRTPTIELPGGPDTGGGNGRRASRTVAGFDLTFSVPKSVSVAWALADGTTRERIYAAHQAAVEFVIGYAEREVVTTRTGKGGVVSEPVRGVVAAGFDHWDSRAGDPQLHTHVVVLNRAQAAADGGWRTVDSRALFKANVALSELYNGALMDLLTADLGWAWQAQHRARATSPTWEVAGVGKALREEFSRRSAAINDATTGLIASFVASHGRQPSAPEVIRLRQQATLATRPDKQLHPLAELVRGWRRRAKPHLDAEPTAWVATLANRCDLPALHAADLKEGMLRDAATVVVAAVATRRATFTRSNVLAEALRQLHGIRFTTPHERTKVAERVTALSLQASVQLTPPEPATRVPEGLQRPDGSTLLRARDATIYTTTAVLTAEEHLLEAGRATDAPTVPQEIAAAVTADLLPGHEGRRLTTEQADAVCRVVTSGRALDVLVGPAGTGKSTAMAGVRAAWEDVHGRGSVLGLAPSAAAAEVLAEAVGVATENTAKWLVEHARTDARLAQLAFLEDKLRGASPSLRTRALTRRARQVHAELNRWRLRPGQLVIVDEASMAGTLELDHLSTIARESGAKLLLVGDPAQLSPVAAGGAFRLLVTDRGGAPELVDVRRFRHEWERDATLALRDGRPTAAVPYFAHGRVTDGDRDAMVEALYQAWRVDTRAGRTSLMVAADAATVSELNQRARADLISAGLVAENGITISDGTVVGEGDLVVSRLNQRDLNAATGWVKNGDRWTVSTVHDDGSLTVCREDRPGTSTRLPADYVPEHVELGYATTAHRAQGRTVDTCHAYVSAATVREPLYVMATRGRETNRLYVDTSYDPDTDTAHEVVEPFAADQVLRKVLATSGADLSATEARTAERVAAMSPARLEAEGAAIQNHRRQQRYTELLLKLGVSRDEIAVTKTADRWRPLLAQMRHAETLGLDLESAVPVASKAARSRPLARFEAELRALCDLREGNSAPADAIVDRAAPAVADRSGLGLER